MFGFQFAFMTDSRCHRISRRQPAGTGHFTEVRSCTKACVRIVSQSQDSQTARLFKKTAQSRYLLSEKVANERKQNGQVGVRVIICLI